MTKHELSVVIIIHGGVKSHSTFLGFPKNGLKSPLKAFFKPFIT